MPVIQIQGYSSVAMPHLKIYQWYGPCCKAPLFKFMNASLHCWLWPWYPCLDVMKGYFFTKERILWSSTLVVFCGVFYVVFVVMVMVMSKDFAVCLIDSDCLSEWLAFVFQPNEGLLLLYIYIHNFCESSYINTERLHLIILFQIYSGGLWRQNEQKNKTVIVQMLLEPTLTLEVNLSTFWTPVTNTSFHHQSQTLSKYTIQITIQNVRHQTDYVRVKGQCALLIICFTPNWMINYAT